MANKIDCPGCGRRIRVKGLKPKEKFICMNCKMILTLDDALLEFKYDEEIVKSRRKKMKRSLLIIFLLLVISGYALGLIIKNLTIGIIIGISMGVLFVGGLYSVTELTKNQNIIFGMIFLEMGVILQLLIYLLNDILKMGLEIPRPIEVLPILIILFGSGFVVTGFWDTRTGKRL